MCCFKTPTFHDKKKNNFKTVIYLFTIIFYISSALQTKYKHIHSSQGLKSNWSNWSFALRRSRGYSDERLFSPLYRKPPTTSSAGGRSQR